MSSQTITVAEVRAPAPGKKQASLIDSTGKRWGIHINEMRNYRQFGTYEVTNFKESFFNGKTYYTIEEAIPVSSERTVRPPAAPTYANPPSQAYDDNQRRMDIWVCGAFNNMMANPNLKSHTLSTEDMVAIINNLKAAWKRTLGPQAQPTLIRGGLDKELDDEIPFE